MKILIQVQVDLQNLNNFVQRGGEVLLYLTGADRVCVPAPPGPVEIHELIHVPVSQVKS